MGIAHPVSWELLGVPRKTLGRSTKSYFGWADSRDDVVVECVMLGSNGDSLAKEAISYGASKVYLVDHPMFEHYLNAPYCKNITALVKKYTPEVFFNWRDKSGP